VLAYHFLRTDSALGDQMRHFHDVLTAAVNALTSRRRRQPGVYSGLDYWRTHLATPT